MIKTQTQLNSYFKSLVPKEGYKTFFAFLGNASGRVKANDQGGVYIIDFNGNVQVVFNQRVPLDPFRAVLVGYVDKNSRMLEIIRFVDVYPTARTLSVPLHWRNHQWGGTDTLWVRTEQILYGIALPESGLTVKFVGCVYYLNGWKLINTDSMDLSAYVPTSGARYILVEVDDTGAVNVALGTLVDNREMLEYEDIPLPSASSKPLFAAKVYASQERFRKDLSGTDIIDLRWAGYASGGVSTEVDWDDIVSKPAVFPPDLDLTDAVYPRKWQKSTAPTVDDDASAGYAEDDIWHDQANRKFYILHDATDGAADWYYLGSSDSSNGGTIFAVEGALVVVDNATSILLITADTTIDQWRMYIENLGTAGSTILDVILKRVGDADVSIFDDGITDNRPEMLYSDTDHLITATPLIVDFLAGDILQVNIDQVATGAADVVLAGAVGASAGSEFNLSVSDGVTTVSHVGQITLGSNIILTDMGGGEVSLVADIPAWLASHPDNPPASPDAMDDEFNGASLDAKWTLLKDASSGATYAVTDSHLFVSVPASNAYRQFEINQPISGTWKFRAKIKFESLAWDYIGLGLCVHNNTSGKTLWAGLMYHASYGSPTSYVGRYTGETANSEAESIEWRNGDAYLEIENDGTNIIWRISLTGNGGLFSEFYREAISSFVSSVDAVGIYIHQWTNGAYKSAVSVDWFRRIA